SGDAAHVLGDGEHSPLGPLKLEVQVEQVLFGQGQVAVHQGLGRALDARDVGPGDGVALVVEQVEDRRARDLLGGVHLGGRAVQVAGDDVNGHVSSPCVSVAVRLTASAWCGVDLAGPPWYVSSGQSAVTSNGRGNVS